MSSINVETHKTHSTSINHSSISEELANFVSKSAWSITIQESFFLFLEKNTDIRSKLNNLFKNRDLFTQCIPIITYQEKKDIFTVLFTNKLVSPPEPGEPGSILSYFRSYGYTDSTLYSDCYGQLSCSSCAIEVMNGTLENPTPRDEEYDMLSIDDNRPPTQYTRLSCQTVVGDSPLILTIRK
ncbi:hypothetical protein DID78_00615 [Candidatus Marinamargulisbacteria bacterium SCGC AG-343-D04]|nr:hypothetical protein DID78_00615 [Candidatus Marinamargulisbacteria bacterium SCGC AG-343-D04]